MSKQKKINLTNEWDIVPPLGATADELRACVYYEFARESSCLLEAVDKHRLDPEAVGQNSDGTPDGITQLDFIEAISMPLANMIRAMGKQATLSKPWPKLPAKLRSKMIKTCSASVRLATPEELRAAYSWPYHYDQPEYRSLSHIESKDDHDENGKGRRLLCFVIDTNAPAALIQNEIVSLFNKHYAKLIGDSKGCNSKGTRSLRADLQDLAVLRLLSSRDHAEAVKCAISAGHKTLIEDKYNADNKKRSDPTRYNRVKDAQLKFSTLFPSLLLGSKLKASEIMTSAVAYYLRHPK
jgi:hypothetical protein